MTDFELGVKHYQTKNYIEAKTHFLKSIELEPNNIVAYHNLGVTFIQLGENEEALRYLKHSQEYNYVDSYISAGAAFRNLGRYKEALTMFGLAFLQDNGHAVAYSNYSNTLREFGDYELALDYIKIANRLGPDNTSLLNESITYLAMGNFTEGWKKYNYRWFYETGESLKPNLPGPEYNGMQDINGKTVLVYCEQGFGDCIQFIRYISLLENLNANVIIYSKEKLYNLFKHNFPNVTVLNWNTSIGSYHYHVALLDLPKCFNTTIDNIPSPTSYLSVDEKLKIDWKNKLGPKTKHRVGLSWTSNGIAYNTKFRKMDLSELLKVTSDEYEFISLHFDPNQSESELLQQHNIKSYPMGDFYDTAGLLSNLDCVITVDTVTAHLSGALGVPTFVMLPSYGCDWRWFKDRNDSPFYQSMKLFRKANDDWDSVIQDLKFNLKFIG